MSEEGVMEQLASSLLSDLRVEVDTERPEGYGWSQGDKHLVVRLKLGERTISESKKSLKEMLNL